LQLHKVEELAQVAFLLPAQPLGFGEHAFDHFSRLVPIAVITRFHKCLASSRTRTVRGDDIGDDGASS
jgi:hypothetical protein